MTSLSPSPGAKPETSVPPAQPESASRSIVSARARARFIYISPVSRKFSSTFSTFSHCNANCARRFGSDVAMM